MTDIHEVTYNEAHIESVKVQVENKLKAVELTTKEDLLYLIDSIQSAHHAAAQGYITFQSSYFELTDATTIRAIPKNMLDTFVAIGALHSSIWKRAKFTGADLEKTNYDFDSDKPRLANLINAISAASTRWNEFEKDAECHCTHEYRLVLTDLYGALDLVNYLIDTNYYLDR